MNCTKVKSLIQLYMDNELDARSTLDVQQHLESCLACSRQLEILNDQDRKLKSAASAVSYDVEKLRTNVLSTIRSESEPKPSRLFTFFDWRRLGIAAAALIVLSLVILRTDLVFNNSVYASVVSDHARHCSLEHVEGMGAVTNIDELNRLVALYGKMNIVPDLSSFGYYNPHGLICTIKGNKALHLIYYDKKQQPISIFLRLHKKDGIDQNWVVKKIQNFNIASKTNRERDVLVVSSSDERIAAIANFVL